MTSRIDSTTPFMMLGSPFATTRSPSPASFETAHCRFSSCFRAEEEEEDYHVEEDDTSICVTMDMPGVKGRDIHVSIQDGILTVEGYRRLGAGSKKQRLQRQVPVDVRAVDVTRAVAQIYKDSLVLYAPKQSRRCHGSFMEEEELELEFCTPAADRLRANE